MLQRFGASFTDQLISYAKILTVPCTEGEVTFREGRPIKEAALRCICYRFTKKNAKITAMNRETQKTFKSCHTFATRNANQFSSNERSLEKERQLAHLTLSDLNVNWTQIVPADQINFTFSDLNSWRAPGMSITNYPIRASKTPIFRRVWFLRVICYRRTIGLDGAVGTVVAKFH